LELLELQFRTWKNGIFKNKNIYTSTYETPTYETFFGNFLPFLVP